MARKLIEIERDVSAKALHFSKYLEELLPSNVLDFVKKIKDKTNVYLFSGIIRDYFIGYRSNFRDIDLIIEDGINIEELFPDLTLTINSFGGYKILINDVIIDLWVIKNTWALNHGQLKIDFQHIDHIPYTTFFNFSSIVFSLNTKCFIIGKPFLRFLRDKEIDVVFVDNPYPELCIVNSFYYSEKFKLKISKRLKDYILKNYDKKTTAYTEIQEKHFGKLEYSIIELIKKIDSLKNKNNGII